MWNRWMGVFVAIALLLIAPARAAQEKLEIVKATWLDGKTKVDVTAAVAGLVKSDHLDFKVDPAALGVKDAEGKRTGRLEISYKLGAAAKSEAFNRGKEVWIASIPREQATAIEKLPQLRKKYPDGIVVLYATYGGSRKTDVTDMLQSVVSGDSLSAPVNTQAFGDPSPGSQQRLFVMYHDGKEIKEVTVDDGKTLQIGPKRTSMVAVGGGLVNLDQRIAELRKKYPEGLLVLQATYGAGRRKDVTEALQAVAGKDSLTAPVSTQAFGDPQPGASGYRLQVVYTDGKEVKDAEVEDGKTLQIGPTKLPVVARDGALVDLGQKLAKLRKDHPKDLLIVDARYGRSRFVDVTEKVQSAVWEDSLTIPVGNATLGDADSHECHLDVYYAIGDEIKFATEKDEAVLQIGKRVTTLAMRKKKGLLDVHERVDALRKKYPTGLIVLLAEYGEGNQWIDVTDALQAVTSGDSLTVLVNDQALGDPLSSSVGEQLELTYMVGDEIKTIRSGQPKIVQIGPRRTAIEGIDGKIINLDARIAERRQDHPKGLLIVEAHYGGHGVWVDVTDRLQDQVKGQTLKLKITNEAMGASDQSSPKLYTTYFDGEKAVTVETAEGGTLQIDSKTVVAVSAGGIPLSIEERLEAFRKIYGDGLIILDAQYGLGGPQFSTDVRELLQKAIVDNRLSIKVGEGWPDPSPSSSGKDVTVTYWDGRAIKKVTQRQWSTLDLRDVRRDGVQSLAAAPAFAAVGQRLTHQFGAKGTYALVSGPTGATLDASGKLAWTPAPDQVGLQDIQFTLTIDGKANQQRASIEVVSAETAQNAGGDPSKLESLLTLNLGEGPVLYTPGLQHKCGLMLRNDELIVVNADGTTLQKRSKLEKQYTQIAERKDYYIALTKEPRAMELLDKTTLKPTRTIKLPYTQLTDMALHPQLPVSFVAVEDSGSEGARYRVLIIDEKSGEVREPDNLIGRYLAIAPDGTQLYTGYKDVYKKGMHLFMNPDGQIWDSPEYGNIDILMVYDLNGTKTRLSAFKEKAGANGAGLRLSPDGQRLTYLSAVGYPLNSGAIPGWDPTDLVKKPATYECKGKAGATQMNYHPTLPLVVVPAETGALLFDRETGDELKDRLQILATTLQGARIEDAWFSADGESVILLCRRGTTAFLYKAQLKLSAAEKATAQRGVRAPAAPAPARKIDGPGTGRT